MYILAKKNANDKRSPQPNIGSNVAHGVVLRKSPTDSKMLKVR